MSINSERNLGSVPVYQIPSPVTVFTEYAPLVKSRALAFMCSGSELDDLIQEGNIGLYYASLKYDCELSAFPTFARKCIDSTIIDYLRKSRKISNIPQEMLLSINELEVADTSNDPEYSVSVKDEYKQMLERSQCVLSELEHLIFSDMLHGYSYDEIAVKHGVKMKTIRNAVQRIRAKLK